MARAVVTAGSAASFVVAAVAGVLGNQLTEDAVWAWTAFGVALVMGAGLTALVAYRSTPGREQGPASGNAVADAGEPEQRAVEGPVARKGDVILKGKYVAGHDMTITTTGAEDTRGRKRS
jgi:hypothetical protein